ncbi:class 3-domain-containing protein [Protomyces lactucae-debilis]|uniref:Class 3-domain-containing protein n=1 Tax=Protomyces lactucae-debilis TaxID=2754530 RepID=A0A1Y2FDH8_PROLT|nr:class 3-domain-containing protein [Protomyces lactucae-debilis]ORY81980.1 class 3-domain-containing protein [Protomyces lactucae-debilis]
MAVSFSSLAKYYLLASLAAFASLYALNARTSIYMLLVAVLGVGLVPLMTLFVSISLTKIFVSSSLRALRAALRLPFRLIRHAPKLVRRCFEFPIILTFFLWFRLLVFWDRFVLRRALQYSSVGRHASGRRISVVNSTAPTFEPMNYFADSEEFDVRTALSLANFAKLAYEDKPVILHELKKAGFETDSFRTVFYQNTSAFLAVKDGVVVISFRGTEPLNLMHVMTDLKGRLVKIADLDDSDEHAGRVHYGFLKALRLHRKDQPKPRNTSGDTSASETEGSNKRPANKRKTSRLVHDAEDSIGSIFSALLSLPGLLTRSAASFVMQPIDVNFPLSRNKITAFEQIQKVLEDYDTKYDIEKIFVTGHSLGAALSVVWYAQTLLTSSPLVSKLADKIHVCGFGTPRLADKQFKRWMDHKGYSKNIWKVVNAQDMVPRQPGLAHDPLRFLKLEFAECPGMTVHLRPLMEETQQALQEGASLKTPHRQDSLKIQESIAALDESDGSDEAQGYVTYKDGYVPPMRFWTLSGLLSMHTIRIIRSSKASWLWIAARIFIPFVMFDHIPGEYTRVLSEIWEESDEAFAERQLGKDTSMPNGHARPAFTRKRSKVLTGPMQA